MAYRFALAQVLRLRTLALEQEEQTLTRIHNEIAQLKAALIQTAEDRAENAAVREQVFSSAALPAMHLHASYAATQEMRERYLRLEQQLRSFEQLREQQVARYEQAYRSREALLGLETADRAAWDARQARQLTRIADEAFLSRWISARAATASESLDLHEPLKAGDPGFAGLYPANPAGFLSQKPAQSIAKDRDTPIHPTK
jgi:flagellar export protein FliJ